MKTNTFSVRTENTMATNEGFERGHRKNKLSTSSLPFLSSYNSSTSISSYISPTSDSDYKGNSPLITPCIREPYYGQSLGMRSNSQMTINLDTCNGPPDLIHWGKYFGSRSSQFLNNDFISKKWKANDESYSKDEDGYVGFYYYANGINFDRSEITIEDYIFGIIGLEKKDEEYTWKKDANIDFSTNSKKDIVVTYCSYNIFSKADLRSKFKIRTFGSSKAASVKIEKSYQIIPNSLDSRNRKVYSFSMQTIKNLSSTFWEELTVSQIVRLFNHLDNPDKQITGLVSYANLTSSKQVIIKSAKLLVKFLNKGNMTETDPAIGSITGTGNSGESNKKTNQYKNSIVDSLLRICSLDTSGEVSDITIDEIRRRYYISMGEVGEWDIVILKILKVRSGSNKETEYIRLIHKHLNSISIHNTQLALVLIEQVKFLISKKDYETALKIAKICIEILPLDFETWYNLALCYILVQDYANALLVMNSIPIILSQKLKNMDTDSVAGVKDIYIETFINRLNYNEEVISEKTFESYFPRPRSHASNYPRYVSLLKKSVPDDALVDEGSIQMIWNDLFLFNSHLRRPISGNQFYQSPLMNSSARELSSVDPNLIRLCGPSSAKIILSAQSAGTSSSSILDFDRKSTWGRCYDLLSFLIALVGWDDLIRIKERVFKSLNVISDNSRPEYVVNNNIKENTQVVCEGWLDQLFLIIYEDLKSLMLITAHDKEQHHSAIEWEMLGLLGWSVKYNLNESISSLMTSVMGTAALGGFDYFGTVQLLEIYDEFILSEVLDSNISALHDDYELKLHTHKLILNLSEEVHDEFIRSLEEDYLTLDFILLNLMKLISWNVRWYQYVSNYLVTKILTKLCTKYDLVFIRSKIRVVFEQNKLNTALKTKNKNMFSLSSILGYSSTAQPKVHEFLESDTIVDYTEKLIRWIDEINLLVATR